MFQNFSEIVNNQKISDDREENKVVEALKEIFSFHNCIIYILAFLVSIVSIKNEILPFGLAIIGACIGSTVPIFMVYIFSFVSTAIFHGGAGLASYFYTSLIFFLLIFVFKPKVSLDDRNEVFKVGSRLFAASFIYLLIKNIRGVFLIYDLFLGFIISCLTYTFYKIFVNGIVVIRDLKEKKAFAVEEVIAASIIIAIAISVFKDVKIFELSISNIFIIFMVMWLGWKNGMLVGATTGISVGLALTLIGNFNIMQLTVFAVAGILSGILSRFGKIGVILGFVLGNAILTYITNGNTVAIIHFREIFIASIGLLFVHPKFKIDIKDFFEKEKLLTNTGEHRLNYYEDVNEKLNAIVNTISNVDKTYNLDNKNMDLDKDAYIDKFLDLLQNYEENIFYEDVINNEGLIGDIFDVLKDEDIITESFIIEIFRKYNNYILLRDKKIKDDLQEIIKLANRAFRELQMNLVRAKTKKEEAEKIKNELKNVSNIINKVSKNVKENVNLENKEKELKILLKGKNFSVNDIEIKRIENGKTIVTLDFTGSNETINQNDKIKIISDIISKTMQEKYQFQKDKKLLNTERYVQIYAAEDKLSLQVGSAKINKEGNSISGDTTLQVRLDDGKYLLAISDGMGSGPKARENSKAVITNLRNLLTKGFYEDDIIRLINSDLMIKKDDETYASLDMSILDLYKPELSIFKNGACNTYLKNQKTVNVYKSKQMPVGIVENIGMSNERIGLEEGDVILMCSDGLLEAKGENRKDWIEEFLRNVNTDSVQKIADLIVSEAVDNSFGIVKDDITVIVAKVIKKQNR